MASNNPEPAEEINIGTDINSIPTFTSATATATLDAGVIGEDKIEHDVQMEAPKYDDVIYKEKAEPVQEINTNGGAEANSVVTHKTRSGQKVFKKTCPNGKITVYVGQRDFLDTGDVVEAVEGVVLVDEEYMKKDIGESEEKKVFCQLEGAFRYGKDELEAIGINFEKSLYKNTIQVYPPDMNAAANSSLQRRLQRKLGESAYPFRFTIPPGLSPSLILQNMPGEAGRQCGVDYQLKTYISKHTNDKCDKKRSVSLTIKKLTHAPLTTVIQRPTADLKKDFILSSNPIHLEANLDKSIYYHMEEIKINVSITNSSSRQIRRIKVSVRQFTEICWSSSAQYKRIVAEIETANGFPISPGGSAQRTFVLVPLFQNCKEKRGLALDGHLKEEDTFLASSTIMPTEPSEIQEFKDKHGVIVRYTVKVRLVVSFGSDAKVVLPFILTHPKPDPQVSRQSELKTRPSVTEDAHVIENKQAEFIEKVPEATLEPKVEDEKIPEDSNQSIPPPQYEAAVNNSDHNLITFDDSHNDDDDHGNGDIVFEDFVRLRVGGETDA